MNNKEITRIDIVEGGSIIRQGHYFTMHLKARDSKGATVDLTGKDILVQLIGSSGIVYESAGRFENDEILFDVQKTLPHGTLWMEITATDPNDETYRQKFPSARDTRMIKMVRGADDLEVSGITMKTVKQFEDDQAAFKAEIKQEFDAAVGAITEDAEVILSRGDEPTLYQRLAKDKQEVAVKLAETETEAKRKRELEDLSPNVLSAIEGGEGTSFNLLSIPQDYSVTAKKTTFLKETTNLFNSETVTANTLISPSGVAGSRAQYVVSDFIKVEAGKKYTFKNAHSIVKYNSSFGFLSRQDVYTPTLTVQASASDRWYRVNINLEAISSIKDVQVNEGEIILPYEQGSDTKLVGIAPEKILPKSVIRESIQEKQIDDYHVNFIKTSTNLFDKSRVKFNATVDGNTGQVIANATNGVSNKIKMIPLAWYTGNLDMVRWALYRKNGEFIASFIGKTFRTTSDTDHALVVFPLDKLNTAQVNRGKELLAYEPYIEPEIVGDVLKGISTNAAEGQNLFNADGLVVGYRISPTGEITQYAHYAYSKFIQLKPSTPYIMEDIDSIAIYTDSGTFIRRQDAYINKKFTTPSNGFKARVNLSNVRNKDTAILNEGTVIKTKIHKPKVLDKSIYVDTKKQDYYMTDVPISGLFNTSQVYPDVTTTWRNSVYTDVYALYDALVTAYPDYIVKSLLGNNSLGNPIYLYHFKPAKPNADLKTKMAKNFITTGTHGFEKLSTWTVYLAMKEICERWDQDELLEALRFNAEFLVVPVVCPYSYNNFTRANENGVDINRNFPTPDWSPAPPWSTVEAQDPKWGQYGGAAPASELETQAVMKVFDLHPDIDIQYDFHNFTADGGREPGDRIIWITNANAHVQHMAQKTISRLTRKWRKEFAFIPPEMTWFAGYSDTHAGGMLGNYGYERGIKLSGTLETGARVLLQGENSVMYDANSVKLSVETFVNWMLVNLDELVKRN